MAWGNLTRWRSQRKFLGGRLSFKKRQKREKGHSGTNKQFSVASKQNQEYTSIQQIFFKDAYLPVLGQVLNWVNSFKDHDNFMG